MAGGECGSPGDWDSGILRPEIQFFSQNHFHFFDSRWPGGRNHMGMDQYLLIPFLGRWTSIYQLLWCSPGVQGFDTLPYLNIGISMMIPFAGFSQKIIQNSDEFSQKNSGHILLKMRSQPLPRFLKAFAESTLKTDLICVFQLICFHRQRYHSTSWLFYSFPSSTSLSYTKIQWKPWPI